MGVGKMHADELDTDAALVRRLLRAQFTHWAGLPIEPVPSSGTDNAMYRLGDDLAVRLPRVARKASQVEKDQRWLPILAPQLPLAIPVPVAKGVPGEGYPSDWSVYRWLDGENPTIDGIADIVSFAKELAGFIAVLHAIDPAGGPPPGAHNFFRGAPLAVRDAPTRAAIEALTGIINVEAATAAWDIALNAPVWLGAPVWVHGDLAPGNLLAVRGRLSAVIDFGGLGVGDPAVDLIVAWNLLPSGGREVFRDTLVVDDAMWARGRGWALSIALIQLPYYLKTNPVLVANSRHVLAELLGA